MPDPTLEFRGLDLLTAITGQRRGIRLQIVRGFLTPPDVRGGDYVVAAKTGRSSGDRVADALSVILEGSVGGIDVVEWRTYTDELLAVLDESGQTPGALIARNGYLGLGAGTIATLNARVKNSIPGPIQAKMRQTWSIELESIDPYWIVTTP